MIYDFAVIGGDMRQVYLANYLKNQRYQVITYATKKEGSECKEGKSFENVIREAKCMIGPVVFSKNGEITGSSSNKKMSVETLLQEMTKEQILFGGCINEEIRHECEQKEIKAFDFMKMDDVAIYNAIATAEGAIMEANQDAADQSSQKSLSGPWLWKMCKSSCSETKRNGCSGNSLCQK